MPGNPNVPQGLLNRVRASVTWALRPTLNVTAPYLGRNGISLSLDGDATTFLPTMTGGVQSPEVFQPATLSMHLLRTQTLADLYKAQVEQDSNMGNGIVRPDVVAGGLGVYQITNCAIRGVQPFVFNGTEEGYSVIIGGFYSINSALFGG